MLLEMAIERVKDWRQQILERWCESRKGPPRVIGDHQEV
jgi:hypothetical protein